MARAYPQMIALDANVKASSSKAVQDYRHGIS